MQSMASQQFSRNIGEWSYIYFINWANIDLLIALNDSQMSLFASDGNSNDCNVIRKEHDVIIHVKDVKDK